jgi:hypothetical protein
MTTPIIESAYVGLPAVQTLPTNMRVAGVMSDTSSAPECFINQRFSGKLQAFMISYVNSISSSYAVFEV